ncbi:MAG: hypothetical protein RI897_937 [Verrucomicrobiota bacterium]|jgi:RNA recognition motif-containing protein
MENKLFVGNLSYEITDNDLMDAFSAYGSVLEANVMQDRMSGRSRGFGFVTMSSAEEARSAVEGLHGTDLGGRSLTVNVARPREERGGGGGRPPRRDYGGGGNRY